jgi:hypothetical protein
VCGASPPAIFREASETGGRTGFCRIKTVYRILAARASRNEKAAVVKAVLTDSKISRGLYGALGYEVLKLKKTISAEVSRGIASSLEVVNCRCTSNTRAKWALDEDELETLKERATFFGAEE